MAKNRHTWKFFRAGGVDQVVLADAADLANLHTLDLKLWVALACPVKGVEIDARSLKLLDNDGDGRLRPPEILAAIAWLKEVMKDLADLFDPSDEVPLASISTETAAGRDMLAGAKLILKNLGKPDAKAITLADVSDTEKIFTATKLNGDGIVPPESADDEETAKAITDIMTVMGSVVDRSGKPGIDQARVDGFFAQAALYAAWADAGAELAPLRTLGESTGPAVAALDAVRAKVNDYFARCRLSSFDPRAVAALNASETELSALSTRLLTGESEEVAKLPLARIDGARALPLGDGVNPAWTARIASFARDTVTPLLGGPRTALTEREWDTVNGTLASYDAWLSAKPVTDTGKLDPARVVALAKGNARALVTELIVKDAALATESNQIDGVEKLIRCRRDFVKLLKNFVNFAEFYGKRKAIFQAGTLFLDARSCELCLPVDDAGRHAMLASLSQAYLAYCDCVRHTDKEKRSIVAAFTGGDTDNLMVGRNGVFYDRQGGDWDATITKIVENPISIRQVFWAPYKRFIRLIQEQVAKRAKAADEEQGKKAEGAATDVANADKVALAEKKDEKDDKKEDGAKDAPAKDAPAAAPAAAKEAPKEKEGKGIDIGTVAAIGVAAGAIGAFLSSIMGMFFGLGWWMPVGLAGLLLAISGPSMLVAWLKLRQRNIGPLLDANGWAVNALARINIPFGAALTGLATLPEGSARALQDPFAEKKRPWRFYVFLIVLGLLGGAWFLGKLDLYLPEKIQAATVLHRAPPPAASTSAPPATSTSPALK